MFISPLTHRYSFFFCRHKSTDNIFARLRVARRSYKACAGADRFERDVLGDLAEALEDLDSLLAASDDAEPYLGGASRDFQPLSCKQIQNLADQRKPDFFGRRTA